MTNLHRLSLAITAFGIVLATSQFASAHPGRGGCRRAHAEKRYEARDKNHDGFLTKDEVRPERWDRLKVADANNDGKVSKAEIEQAWKAGKLKRHGNHEKK
jgi:hypothetical protein